MSDYTYTPNTAHVCRAYAREAGVHGVDRAVAEFDRWLNSVKAKAWEEAVGACAEQGTVQLPDNPYEPEKDA